MFESRLAAWLTAIQRVAPRARLGNWGKDLWCVFLCLRFCIMLWIFVLCTCIVVLCLMDCCCFLAVARHTGQACLCLPWILRVCRVCLTLNAK